MTQSPPVCSCGTFAIGICFKCKNAVCRRHSGMRQGARYCSEHLKERKITQPRMVERVEKMIGFDLVDDDEEVLAACACTQGFGRLRHLVLTDKRLIVVKGAYGAPDEWPIESVRFVKRQMGLAGNPNLIIETPAGQQKYANCDPAKSGHAIESYLRSRGAR